MAPQEALSSVFYCHPHVLLGLILKKYLIIPFFTANLPIIALRNRNTMNSKYLVFACFAVWCFICRNWYVCGIKQACDQDPAATTADVIQTPPIEPDTIDLTVPPDDAAQPGKASTTPAATQPAAKPVPMTSAIDRVQMEQVEDRMVVHFPYNSIRREDNDAIDDYLNRLAEQLIASGQHVTITGHTDFVGEAKENIQFGLRRAASIRDALVKKGVKKSQISLKSYGESKSIATNDTPQGRYKNRRVEIRVK